jgi:hypothetical protein
VTRVPFLFRQKRKTNERCPSMTISQPAGEAEGLERRRCSSKDTTNNFTIFEGTSEIQRMIIGRAVTGLDVR